MIHNYYRNAMPNNMYYNYTPIYHNNVVTTNMEPEIVVDTDIDEEKPENKTNDFRIGPANISKDGISIFGFNLHIDDIIIVVVIIFLFLENKKDYLLLIILALMLFDISIDSVKNMKIFKNLFSPS